MNKHIRERSESKLYRFEGSVDVDGMMHSTKWVGETLAPSKAKAESNLKYRYKKEFNLSNFKKVNFVGKVRAIDG